MIYVSQKWYEDFQKFSIHFAVENTTVSFCDIGSIVICVSAVGKASLYIRSTQVDS